MANMEVDSLTGNFKLEQSISAAGRTSVTLQTRDMFVDKNIQIITTTPAGVYSAGQDNSSGNYANSAVTPSVEITQAGTYGFTTTQPTGTAGTNYLIVNPGASATAWKVTPKAEITTAGYIDRGSVNGTAVSATPTINEGDNYYVPIVTPSFAGGAYSTDTDTVTVTTAPAIEITQSGTFISNSAKTTYGVTTTKPSGIDGTAYLSIGGAGSVTAQGVVESSWSVSAGDVTYSNSKGVIAAHSSVVAKSLGSTSGGTSTTFNPTIDTSHITNYYIPVVSSVNVSGGNLSTTANYSGTPTVSIGIDSQTTTGVTITDAAQSSGYYVKLSGGSSSLSGTTTVSRAAVTYSNTAGAIAAHTNASGIASDTISPTVTVNAGSKTSYICIPTAGATISGTTEATPPTILRTQSTATGAINVGSGSANDSAPSSGYFVSVQATAPATTVALTKTVDTKGYLNDETQITASASTSQKVGSIYYLPITTGVGAGNSADVALSTTDGSNNGINISNIVGDKSASEPTSGYYLAFTGSGSSKVTTAGWFPEGAISNGTASATKYFPIVTGTYSASAAQNNAGTVTPSISLETAATSSYGFTKTQPSGTSGTNYLTIDPSGTVTTQWSVTPTATIDTHGYIPTGSVNGSAVSGSPTIAAGENYYVPVVGVSITGGVLSGSTTTTITPSNNITPASGTTSFYIDAAASGSISRTAVTYSNNAGVIAKHNAGTSSGIGADSIDAGSSATRVYLKQASITASNSYAGMSTYFTDGTASNKDVTITPTYGTTEGYTAAASGTASSNNTTYWKIKTTSITETDTTVSGTTATRGTASWGNGWMTANSMDVATFGSAPASGKTANSYVDISSTTSAPVLVSGGYLYINSGYTDDLKISLAKLSPDGASAALSGDYILSGYSAYDNDGNLVSGSIETYEGAYTVD